MKLVILATLIHISASTAQECDSTPDGSLATRHTNHRPCELVDDPKSSCNNAAVVIAIKKYFRSGCIFLIRDDAPEGVQDAAVLSQLQTCLAMEGVASSTADLLQATNSSYCLHSRPLIVVPCESPLVLRRLQQVSFSRPRWLLFLWRSTPEDFLLNVNIPFDCEFLTLKGSVLTESFRVAAHLPLQTHHWGVWDAARGLTSYVGSLYERRNTLQGLVINASTLHNPPINIVMGSDEAISNVGGYIGKIWLTLQERLHFTSVYSVPKDNSWGSYSNKTHKWSGMIAMLLSGEAHVAVCDFVMTEIRTTAIDFMAPLLITRSSVFMRKPTAIEAKVDSYLRPFASTLWKSLGLFVLVVCLVITSWVYLSVKFTSEGTSQVNLLSTMQNSLHNVIGMISQQGHETVQHSWSALVLFWSVQLTMLIIFISYCSDITAALSTQIPSLPFTSFEEMLEDGSYRLGIVARSSLLDVFDKATDELLKDVYKKMVLPGLSSLPRSMLEGFQRICTHEKYTFIHTFTTAMGLQEKLSCTITSVPQASFPTYMSMVIAKESPYLGIINHVIQGFRRTGALRRLYLQTWNLANDDEDAMTSSVEFLQVSVILLLLLVGMALSLKLLAFEIMEKRILNCLRRFSPIRSRIRSLSIQLEMNSTISNVRRRLSYGTGYSLISGTDTGINNSSNHTPSLPNIVEDSSSNNARIEQLLIDTKF